MNRRKKIEVMKDLLRNMPLNPSSTVMFAEYSLNVRYIRCLDPNIKRTYEFFFFFFKSGNVQRMFGEGFNSGRVY